MDFFSFLILSPRPPSSRSLDHRLRSPGEKDGKTSHCQGPCQKISRKAKWAEGWQVIPIWGSFRSVGGKTREEGQTAWSLGREQDFSVPIWLHAFFWVGIRDANPRTEAEPLGEEVLLPRPERAWRESGCGQSLGNELFQGHRERGKLHGGPANAPFSKEKGRSPPGAGTARPPPQWAE